MNGMLVKSGVGVVTFAGPLKFGETGQDDMPSAMSNVCMVTGGKVKVARCGSVDGMAFSLTNDTRIVLEARYDDPELTRWGILDAKTDRPFTLLGDLAELPVEIDLSAAGDIPERGLVLGLVTVSSDSADRVRSIMPRFAQKLVAGYPMKAVEIVDNDRKLVTFALDMRRPALVLSIR
jgi:hypothetical protein